MDEDQINNDLSCMHREISRLREALRRAARNDKTSYRHHEIRPFDGRKPATDNGTIWLTPREIARRILNEPELATAADARDQKETANG